MRRSVVPSKHLHSPAFGSLRFVLLFVLMAMSMVVVVACGTTQRSDPEPAEPATGALKAEEHTAAHTTTGATHSPPTAEASSAVGATCGAEDHGPAGCGQGDGTCGCAQHASDEHSSCGGGAPEQAAANADQAAVTLTRVDDPSQICMVRNHFMGRPQLAVEAEGGTYYGCCAGCANRLLQDPRARQAIDPVSHNPVDKALAVLAKTPRGQVLYFENETNLEMFRAALR